MGELNIGEKQLREVVRGLIFDALRGKRSAAKLEDIKDGVSLTTGLGIDSLDLLQIAATVEKKYKIRIPEEELRKMGDLGGIVKVVQKYLPA